MALPLNPPLSPQLARPRASLPTGDEWVYEPKWDGFRALAFVDGAEVDLRSRNGRDLLRYFPELRFPEGRYVLDGEIVVFGEGGTQDFDRLGQRIHPAKSRVDMLAEETPATFIAFDLLARDDDVLLDLPYEQRRAALEEVVERPVDLTPSTRSVEEAEPWLHSAEGVIAKQVDAPYKPGERTGMAKIKRVRTIDAVVVGWRPGKKENTVGALILGLYGDDGKLHVVGHTSGLKAKEKRTSSASSSPTRPASAGRASPRAGRRAATSNGWSCGPSWSSR